MNASGVLSLTWKNLIPRLATDYNDEIRQEQMWEMQILNTAMQRRPLLAAASPATSESPPGSLSPGSPPLAAQPGGRHAASPPPQQAPPPQQQQPPPQQAPLRHPALRGLEPAAADVATGAAGVVAVAGGAQAAASTAAASAAAVIAQQQQQQQAAATAGGGVAGAPMVGRKRPLLPGGGRPAMSPTKRTVLSNLARARAAQANDLPDYLHPANGRSAGIPVLREDIIPGGGLV